MQKYVQGKKPSSTHDYIEDTRDEGDDDSDAFVAFPLANLSAKNVRVVRLKSLKKNYIEIVYLPSYFTSCTQGCLGSFKRLSKIDSTLFVEASDFGWWKKWSESRFFR